jgi:iron uptake system component EfeO
MTDQAPTPVTAAPSRLMSFAVVGAAALAVAAGALFYYASTTAPKPAPGGVRITVGDRSCDPTDLTVPAGLTTFEIRNASQRTLEWEILDGVMVIDERENITPGLRAQMTVRLKPGRYQITCGLLSNPRGTLTVTASAASEAERRKPPLKAFIGPLSEFRVYTTMESAALTQAVQQLADAIHGGQLDAARAAYGAARLPYRRLDLLASRFSDLRNAIDPLPDYLAERERDPGFSGFHRLEYGLFKDRTLDGLAPVADRLVADVATLTERIRALRLAPDEFGSGVDRLARYLAEGQILRGDNHYAQTDLADLAGSLAGMDKVLDLMTPLLRDASAETLAQIDRARADAHAALDPLNKDDVYPPYDQVDQATRQKLAKSFTALADAAGKLNPAIGLD